MVMASKRKCMDARLQRLVLDERRGETVRQARYDRIYSCVMSRGADAGRVAEEDALDG